MLRERTVVLGVSGGIAAYKACELVRWLKQEGASVVVVMTQAATEFVTPLTFETLSGNPVVVGLWGSQRTPFELPPRAAARMHGKVEHVDLAEAADLIVIAPATADLIARLVHGAAPDALTALALASRAPLVICPAMDLEMWRHPATQANIAALRARGAWLVGPERGALASGLEGLGRLASLEAIAEAIEQASARRSSMEGLRVVVGAGRTEEPLDPVRVLTNRSSGRMGCALAAAARDRGAEVTLVAGPMSIEPPSGVEQVAVTTAREMEQAMNRHAGAADLIVMAAAVADYRPARSSSRKIESGAARSIELAPNPDILAGLSARRRPGQVLVGFALETAAGTARARRKRVEKGVDLIVMNRPQEGLSGETNRVTLIEARGQRSLPRMSKREVAEAVLDRALAIRALSTPRAPRSGTRAPRAAPGSRASSPGAKP
jgi:phosphopantothenoylcysteine decarboxylase/phosphopantothenate--cysteine ligase